MNYAPANSSYVADAFPSDRSTLTNPKLHFSHSLFLHAYQNSPPVRVCEKLAVKWQELLSQPFVPKYLKASVSINSCQEESTSKRMAVEVIMYERRQLEAFIQSHFSDKVRCCQVETSHLVPTHRQSSHTWAHLLI